MPKSQSSVDRNRAGAQEEYTIGLRSTGVESSEEFPPMVVESVDVGPMEAERQLS